MVNNRYISLSENGEILLENLKVALLLIDHQRIVHCVNMAAETFFEQSRRYLIGKKLDELIPMPSVVKCSVECLQHYSQFTLREVSLKLSQREVLIDITLSYLTVGTKDQPMVLLEINSINRISGFIKDKNQHERQQSFRLMMRGLAHEIKNPLGGLRGAAQLLGDELNDSGQKELTSIMIKEADRLSRLVDRVAGPREQLKPVAINIHEVLEHVAQLANATCGYRLVVHRSYDPALPEIVADREQLIQAVLNITANAIESQGDSKHPTIGLVSQFERFITINQQHYRQALKIKIWDEGPGVPDALRDVIFDPLISGRAEGTGLGLSITQEIVQRHKGVVQLEQYQGKTCFSISLPYLPEINSLSPPQVAQ